MHRLLPTATVLALTGTALTATAPSAEEFTADVWADNWFEMRVNGVTVAEDSVPITTERSFNAESFAFEADRPFVIGVVAMDYKQNDTGLEYIGTGRQQMGDGGLIAQIRDAEGRVVAVSDDSWQCLVTHSAPSDKSCESEEAPVAGDGACGFETAEEPVGWDHAGFEAANWKPASLYTKAEVSPRGGYDEIDWASEARLIWGPDLEQSNTVLCRVTVE